MFEIDFGKLIYNLLPWFLRTGNIPVWIYCLLSPLASLYQTFLVLRDTKKFEASITGQVAYLEYMLNLIFYNNGSLKIIFIVDATREEECWIENTTEEESDCFIYNTAESEPTVYICNIAEGETTYDFIVKVPDTLVFDPNYLKSLVTKYKQAGSTFTVQPYIYIPED